MPVASKQVAPGCFECVRVMLHRQVLLPYNPWDTGSSRVLMRNASGDAEVCAGGHCVGVECDVFNCGLGQAMQQLLEETGADGYNGDTMVPFSPNQHPSRTSA